MFYFSVLLHEEDQLNFVAWFEDALKVIEESQAIAATALDVFVVDTSDNNSLIDRVCQGFANGAQLVIDVTWISSKHISELAKEMNVPYLKVDISMSPFLDILDKYLDQRNCTDVALIFSDPKQVDEALYYWIDTEKARMVITDTLDRTSARRLKGLRPIPYNYAIIGRTEDILQLFELALDEELFKLPDRWNFVFLDFNYKQILPQLLSYEFISLISMDEELCCSLLDKPNCKCPNDFIAQKQFLTHILKLLVEVIDTLTDNNTPLDSALLCNETRNEEPTMTSFMDILSSGIDRNKLVDDTNGVLRLQPMGNIEMIEHNDVSKIGTYTSESGFALETGQQIKPIQAFYRVGVTEAVPWSYKVTNSITNETHWEGYCLDFVAKLAEMMDFDYEIVEPERGTFGKKNRKGHWNGVVGDLQSGETDLAITALVMTADREEVIDFVAPYFEQSGISIVMRKPIVKTSLFKFMTVLKLEVWLSIVGALIVTGFMIWFLDKYSPYSAQNNKKAYPYPCREFTLKESFWFALTSFTPQGGGEAPKSLSGRTLVAAYWLFVVLMLATFSSNLSAFLTVEMMQTSVQSLEQLAQQSRINYTVVDMSQTHHYFINMKNAEDTLYRLWKELTLNASTDETQYRVWDYPIREQYGHILIAINDSMPVADAAEGFRKVNEYTDFAFIHDSAEIKYEVSRNCNLTEVGEVFAEKPYAIAIQQGSQLNDEISKTILDLQKDRFFEYLQAKYWNYSKRGECENSDNNEGITLESLGGVFIATLFGLALAMITLIGEVIYYKRKRMKMIYPPGKDLQSIKTVTVKPAVPDSITFGTTFKPVHIDKDPLRVSPITLYPRSRNRIN
uniref:Ionotropic receptor 1 n=1 Tax=Holotrichia parallela TaxID=93412 RepID=A0A2P9JY84_HOLPA|nr:ionotropic receptor 1 [Holotrichia parallela]